MKKLIISFIMLFSVSAHAIDVRDVNEAGFEKLSVSQQAEVLAAISKAAVPKPVESNLPNIPTPAEIEKYSDVGVAVGKALGSAARELGVVANEFVYTPVGMVTAGLIIYKVVGTDLVKTIRSLFKAFVFGTCSLLFYIWFIRRMVDTEIQYSATKTNWLGQPTIDYIKKNKLSDERAWGCFGLFGLCIIITICLL